MDKFYFKVIEKDGTLTRYDCGDMTLEELKKALIDYGWQEPYANISFWCIRSFGLNGEIEVKCPIKPFRMIPSA